MTASKWLNVGFARQETDYDYYFRVHKIVDRKLSNMHQGLWVFPVIFNVATHNNQ